MSEEVTPYVSWQDYIETLKTLPKAKMLDLFQRRHIRSMIVRVFFISIEMCFWISLLLKTYVYLLEVNKIRVVHRRSETSINCTYANK